MTYLHMHSAMANKAMYQARYTEGLYDQPEKEIARIKHLVLSGWADYKSKWENIDVTQKDRELVLHYLNIN